MKKIFVTLMALGITVSSYASYNCHIDYKGPKLSAGGSCVEKKITLKECEEHAKAVFDAKHTTSRFRFSIIKNLVIFTTWVSMYNKVEMTYYDGPKEIRKVFKRKRASINPRVTQKWGRSCDVRDCILDSDIDSCEKECRMDMSYREGVDIDLLKN